MADIVDQINHFAIKNISIKRLGLEIGERVDAYSFIVNFG